MLQYYPALVGLLTFAAASPHLVTRAGNTTTTFKSWKELPMSADLKYVPCFENFTCANLEVPLDYDNTSAGTTNIAFVKYSSAKQPALGDLIINPGGPGGSGVDFVIGYVEILTNLLGDSYNFIGMDPRGVNNSGPNTDCFAGSPSVRDYYISQLFDFEPNSNESISKYYEGAGGFGTWCSRTLNDSAKYANTPATARDMLQYAEKLAKSQGKNPDEALVDFYGISYGSALGTTFASLYPNRVGRFIIDAVLDGEDYYFGNWSQSLLQADAAVEGFFDLCAKAGKACVLNGNGSMTADQIKIRVDNIIGHLENNPLAVTDPSFVELPVTVGHADLRNEILLAVYDPATSFTGLSQSILDIENGNGTLAALSSKKGAAPPSECDHASPEKSDEFPKTLIACNDNNKHFNGTKENLFELLKLNEHLSKYVGSIWTPVIVPQCRNLKFTPPKNQVFEKYTKVQTKTPILFTDNVIDPVTSSAHKMSTFYQGSVVLLQEAIGHGLIVTTSNCTSGYLDKYLRTAALPPVNTTCATNFNPFFSAE